MARRNGAPKGKVRYAVVGLGHIAQIAVLPAFVQAKNSELTALVSEHPLKQKKLSQEYGVKEVYRYEEYELCLRSGQIDAVYIALPNHLHRDFTVRAARAGIHVLCEKPLAVTEDECHEMIKECADNGVHLMTAYRLHLERANLEAIRVVRSGEIGRPRVFNSLFSMQVKEGNIRLRSEMGGGTLYDIGVYCINAARYLFQAEPTEVFAYSANSGDKRFRQIDEMTSALLRFPEERLASFTCSFGAADTASYEVLGTKGLLRLTNAYEYAADITMEITHRGRTRRRTFPKRDQFGPELVYFSDCILRGRAPEPSGVEGLIDVHVVRSLYESAQTGLPVKLKELRRRRRPSLRQEMHKPPIEPPEQVAVQAPSR